MSAQHDQTRSDQIDAFCNRGDWNGAARAPLAGDASNRRYFRLTHPDHGRAVLMDAPPQMGEDVAPFVTIATHLLGLGLSAPKIYDQDPDLGFLLLEDLGDDLFARVLEQEPALEKPLYLAATDALITAQSADAPAGLPNYAWPEMTQAATLALDWYVSRAEDRAPTADDRERFTTALETTLFALKGPRVLVQRDYHAENLLWLPDREGAARTGLLDFQDAALGHPAYDLASLLVDVRRVVSSNVRETAITHYLAKTGYAEAPFRCSFATLSAQRNLRILGVFTRLCVRDGKTSYPDLLPRVWDNLQNDLTHPALSELKDVINHMIPPVTAQIIATLKSSHAD